MDLKDKKCIPCHSWVPPLTQEQKEVFLQDRPGWTLTHENSRINREFKFKNFKRALEFTNLVGEIAEEQKHHPEIHLGWGHTLIEIWTHANNNLLENDFILAAKIDEVFETFSSSLKA
jgi:4a-hydroxytetrahydrobiopterin dehydratase